MHLLKTSHRGARSRAPLLSFAAFWLLAPALLLAAEALPQQQATEEDLQEGLRLAEQGRFEDALALLARFKRRAPSDARGYLATGRVLFAGGRLEEASAEFLQSVRLEPGCFACRHAAARALTRLNKLQAAIEVLEPIAAQAPSAERADALWLLSDLYYRRESWGDARRLLGLYSKAAPTDLRYHLRLAQIHLIEGRFGESIAFFREVVQRRPELAPAWHGLGIGQWRTGDRNSAQESLLTAIEKGDHPDYRLDLGKLLLEMGDAQAALKHLKAASFAGSAGEADFELARAYRRLGDKGKADHHLQRFREASQREGWGSPSSGRIDSILGQAQSDLRRGSLAQALNGFRKALREDPGNWLAHSFLAKIYLSSNRIELADSHLSQMSLIDPNSAEGNYLLALCRYRQQRFLEAAAAGERSRRHRPDYAELRNLLGNIYSGLGRRNEALEEYAAAVRLAPQRSDFRANWETAKKKLDSP